VDLSAVKQRITTLRGSRTKKEFAGLLGFTPSYLSQIENQEDTQKPSIEALFAISDACDVSIDYILTGHNYASKGMESVKIVFMLGTFLLSLMTTHSFALF